MVNKNNENEMDKMDKIINILVSIETRIEKIENRLEVIENDMKDVNKDCNRMNEHIQFVETAYTVTRGPLNYIKNKIECMMYGNVNTNDELPKLEYNAYKE